MKPSLYWLKCLALLALVSLPPLASATDVYKGTLGKQPVTLVLEQHNRVVRGVYFYDRYRTPIRLKPIFGNNEPYATAIDELDNLGLPAARIRVSMRGFYKRDAMLYGSWSDYRTGKTLPIEMKHVALLRHDESWPAPTTSVLQAASTERFYFQVPLLKDGAPVTAIEVYSKETGALVQTLVFKPCTSEGINTVQVVTVLGGTQLRVGKDYYCPGVAFEWGPQASQFETVHGG